ncbi:MAG: hypothetical protein M3R70_03365 [Actinomycetota bacterium]|nr:hypothetical protein [Actinomycetota bacterium]
MSAPSAQRELDDLVLHLKGLVHVRALLENRGASAAEIEQHATEIERLRVRLAQVVKQSGDRHQAAA